MENKHILVLTGLAALVVITQYQPSSPAQLKAAPPTSVAKEAINLDLSQIEADILNDLKKAETELADYAQEYQDYSNTISKSKGGYISLDKINIGDDDYLKMQRAFQSALDAERQVRLERSRLSRFKSLINEFKRLKGPAVILCTVIGAELICNVDPVEAAVTRISPNPQITPSPDRRRSDNIDEELDEIFR